MRLGVEPSGHVLLRGCMICFASLGLTSCVVSDKPLLAKTQPLGGDHFSVAIYQTFIAGRAHDVRFRRFD